MTTTLANLAQAAVAFRDDRDWKQFHAPKDMALALSLEASELLELFQWSNPSFGDLDVAKKDRLGQELSDVLYWVVLIAHDAGIDLASAFVQKLAHNEAKYPVEKSRGIARKYTEL